MYLPHSLDIYPSQTTTEESALSDEIGATNHQTNQPTNQPLHPDSCALACALFTRRVCTFRAVLCHSASTASREYIAHTLTPRIACTHHRSSKSWFKLLACRACAAFISFASALRIKPMTSLLHSTEPTPCSSSRRMAFLSSMLRHSACQSREGPAGYIVRAQPGPWGAQLGRCSRLPHVHPRQLILNRFEAVACSKGCLEGFLLRRTHDHVELRSAGLHVSSSK